jgi:hypothetical protein
MVLLIYDEFVLHNSPSSLARHFGVNRPIDPNALPFYATMMSDGCFFLVIYPC